MAADRSGTPGRQRAAVAPTSEGQERLLALEGSVRGLASKAGVHPSSLSEWMRGTSMPSPTHAARLETALGIPASSWENAPSGVTSGANLKVALRGVLAALEALDEQVCELRSIIEPRWDR